jgi:cell division protein FtsL
MAWVEHAAGQREAQLVAGEAAGRPVGSPGATVASQLKPKAQSWQAPAEVLQVPAGTPGVPSERPTPPAGAPQRHLRLVPRRRRRRPRWLVWYGFIGGVVAVCFGLVGLHVVIAEAQFRIDSLQRKVSAEQARYERLRLLVAELEAPARVVSVAESELGMRQPASVNYLPAPKLPGAQAGIPSGGSGGAAGTGPRGHGRTVPAPAGDADWPSVKPYLSGAP